MIRGAFIRNENVVMKTQKNADDAKDRICLTERPGHRLEAWLSATFYLISHLSFISEKRVGNNALCPLKHKMSAVILEKSVLSDKGYL